ncbi:MAG: BolA family transcriptional regulator [Gammaproteobacteria bacterium TMED34]|nr:MAG: BolA family transcriptional regulator [Gammaproteobacteria bacterium TMED34]
MEINNLIKKIKKKITRKVRCENITIVDKTFLHKKHKNFNHKKFHIKIILKSSDLKLKKKIEANRYVFSILDKELKDYIHSIQLLIN